MRRLGLFEMIFDTYTNRKGLIKKKSFNMKEYKGAGGQKTFFHVKNIHKSIVHEKLQKNKLN